MPCDLIDLKTLEVEYGEDESHGWPHVSRVRTYCLLISRNYSVDTDVLECSSLLHDIVRDGGDHGLASSIEASKRLVGLEKAKRDLVVKCVFEHNKASRPSSLEGMILQDSDRLDALGAIGLIRIIRHNKLGPKELVRHMRTWELEWHGNLWTPEANTIAAERVSLLWEFVSRVESELRFLESSGRR